MGTSGSLRTSCCHHSIGGSHETTALSGNCCRRHDLASRSSGAGVAISDVNMRTGPGTGYPVITTIPGGAPVEVLGCQSWCSVIYRGTEGFVSGRYVQTQLVVLSQEFLRPQTPGRLVQVLAGEGYLTLKRLIN